jgi:hypothetical protein
MGYYRLYCFDGVNKILSVQEVEAANDEQAERQAALMRNGVKSELWDRDRLVGRFDHSR